MARRPRNNTRRNEAQTSYVTQAVVEIEGIDNNNIPSYIDDRTEQTRRQSILDHYHRQTVEPAVLLNQHKRVASPQLRAVPNRSTVNIRIRRDRRKPVKTGLTRDILLDMNKILRSLSLPHVSGVAVQARRRRRCENAKAVRRKQFFKSQGKGKRRPERPQRKHRC